MQVIYQALYLDRHVFKLVQPIFSNQQEMTPFDKHKSLLGKREMDVGG